MQRVILIQIDERSTLVPVSYISPVIFIYKINYGPYPIKIDR